MSKLRRFAAVQGQEVRSHGVLAEFCGCKWNIAVKYWEYQRGGMGMGIHVAQTCTL
jgi:hypothetical protein